MDVQLQICPAESCISDGRLFACRFAVRRPNHPFDNSYLKLAQLQGVLVLASAAKTRSRLVASSFGIGSTRPTTTPAFAFAGLGEDHGGARMYRVRLGVFVAAALALSKVWLKRSCFYLTIELLAWGPLLRSVSWFGCCDGPKSASSKASGIGSSKISAPISVS